MSERAHQCILYAKVSPRGLSFTSTIIRKSKSPRSVFYFHHVLDFGLRSPLKTSNSKPVINNNLSFVLSHPLELRSRSRTIPLPSRFPPSYPSSSSILPLPSATTAHIPPSLNSASLSVPPTDAQQR